MIYSKKYGRYFNSRQELGRFDWWMRRTKPILSWGGLRDAPYDKEWLKEHRPVPTKFPWAFVLIGGGVLTMFLEMCSKG